MDSEECEVIIDLIEESDSDVQEPLSRQPAQHLPDSHVSDSCEEEEEEEEEGEEKGSGSKSGLHAPRPYRLRRMQRKNYTVDESEVEDDAKRKVDKGRHRPHAGSRRTKRMSSSSASEDDESEGEEERYDLWRAGSRSMHHSISRDQDSEVEFIDDEEEEEEENFNYYDDDDDDDEDDEMTTGSLRGSLSGGMRTKRKRTRSTEKKRRSVGAMRMKRRKILRVSSSSLAESDSLSGKEEEEEEEDTGYHAHETSVRDIISFDEAKKLYLVRWRGKSHWADCWLNRKALSERTTPMLIRNFDKRESETRKISFDDVAGSYLEENEDQEEIIEEADLFESDPHGKWVSRSLLTPAKILDITFVNAMEAKGSSRSNFEEIAGLCSFLVLWSGLSPSEATFESGHLLRIRGFYSLIEDYWTKCVDRAYRPSLGSPQGFLRPIQSIATTPDGFGRPKSPGSEEGKDDDGEQKNETGIGESAALLPYQVEGVNWLVSSWKKRRSVILADEMGLGKTIQCLALFHLLHQHGLPGAFLVVCPLSTVPNWVKETSKWCPHFETVEFCGFKSDREMMKQHAFYLSEGERRALRLITGRQTTCKMLKPNVIVTSYDTVLREEGFLRRMDYACLVVDEGHRLKNREAKLHESLRTFRSGHRLLLTGTPLQNNFGELMSLMSFLNPSRFDGLMKESERFGGKDLPDDGDTVKEIQRELHPYILRRTKGDVLKDLLPNMREIFVGVDFSPLQYFLYRALISRSYSVFMERASMTGSRTSMMNVVMHLRKCCNHPYLFKGIEAHDEKMDDTSMQMLLQASGKLVLVDKLLEKLMHRGHRVLLYSQMTKMLDIIEDYLIWRGYLYCRIDGHSKGAERQRDIDLFNDPGSKHFVFLLSTRAGGLGINLQSADTIIMFDSDWNPYADMQAFSRAHRIGQKRDVLVLRLITRDSIEERILAVAQRKKVWGHLFVNKLNANLSKSDIQNILKSSTTAIFGKAGEKESDTSTEIRTAALMMVLDQQQKSLEDIDSFVPDDEFLGKLKSWVPNYTDEDIDHLLAQREGDVGDGELVSSQGLGIVVDEQHEKGGWKDDFLGHFKVAHMETETAADHEMRVVQMLENQMQVYDHSKTAEETGKGKRKRKVVKSYNESVLFREAGNDEESSQTRRAEKGSGVDGLDESTVDVDMDEPEYHLSQSNAEESDEGEMQFVVDPRDARRENGKKPKRKIGRTDEVKMRVPIVKESSVYMTLNATERSAIYRLVRNFGFPATFSDFLFRAMQTDVLRNKKKENLFSFVADLMRLLDAIRAKVVVTELEPRVKNINDFVKEDGIEPADFFVSTAKMYVVNGLLQHHKDNGVLLSTEASHDIRCEDTAQLKEADLALLEHVQLHGMECCWDNFVEFHPSIAEFLSLMYRFDFADARLACIRRFRAIVEGGGPAILHRPLHSDEKVQLSFTEMKTVETGSSSKYGDDSNDVSVDLRISRSQVFHAFHACHGVFLVDFVPAVRGIVRDGFSSSEVKRSLFNCLTSLRVSLGSLRRAVDDFAKLENTAKSMHHKNG